MWGELRTKRESVFFDSHSVAKLTLKSLFILFFPIYCWHRNYLLANLICLHLVVAVPTDNVSIWSICFLIANQFVPYPLVMLLFKSSHIYFCRLAILSHFSHTVLLFTISWDNLQNPTSLGIMKYNEFNQFYFQTCSDKINGGLYQAN